MYQSCSFVISFDIGNMSPPKFILFQDKSDFLDQFYFYMNFRISLSLFAKKPDGSLIQIALNLQISFMYVFFLTILRFPICESGIYFHVFKSLVSHQCFVVFSTSLSLSVVLYSFQMLLQRTLFSSVDLLIVHFLCIKTQLISRY